MMPPITLVVAALACYRLTMLVVADTITQPWRDRITGRYVHPLHEQTWRPIAREPFAHVRAGVADDETGRHPFMARCRCGRQWCGEEWSDVASEANDHTNRHRGETSTGPRWLVLLDCPWCASMWLAAPIAWSAWCFAERAWWAVPAVMLSLSALTGIIATFAKPEAKQ